MIALLKMAVTDQRNKHPVVKLNRIIQSTFMSSVNAFNDQLIFDFFHFHHIHDTLST